MVCEPRLHPRVLIAGSVALVLRRPTDRSMAIAIPTEGWLRPPPLESGAHLLPALDKSREMHSASDLSTAREN
jgi:hypothetical protein